MKLLLKIAVLPFVTVCLVAGSCLPGVAQNKFPDFPPDSLTKNTHKKQMLEQLGIRLPVLPSTRIDPNRPKGTTPRYPDSLSDSPYGWADTEEYGDGSPKNLYFFRTDWGLWNNYKEELVGQYEPVDLLRAENGTHINTPQLWWDKRRPELAKLCEEDIWGMVPDEAGDLTIRWELTDSVVVDSIAGKCLKTVIRGIIDTSSYPQLKHAPEIAATLWSPLSLSSRKIPFLIHIGECREDFKQAALAQGWGYLVYEQSALQPDHGAYLSDYLIGLLNKGNWRHPQDWGTIRVWAWGISRLLDRLDTTGLDVRRCGVIGFSRLGKTAIATAMFDERIAVVYAGCSGCLGVTPVRRHFGEDLEFIPYYWFAGNMMKYCGALSEDNYLPRKVANLKIDTHAFIALLAPRILFITAGADDLWSDSKGAVLSAKAATPVYELLGKKGLVMEGTEPVLNTVYDGGSIIYHYHEGGHTYSSESLPVFIKLAREAFK